MGLGETLASANQAGLPYKLSTEGKGAIDATQVIVGSFANYSNALVAKSSRVVDYS